MSEKLIESLAQGGILGLILGLVILHQGRQFNILSSKIAELIGLLRERFKLGILAGVLTLGLVSGCKGPDGKPVVVVEACVWTLKYGKICGTYDGAQWKFTAEVQLPPELLGSANLDELVKKIEKPGGEE